MSKAKKKFSAWNILWIIPLLLVLAVAVMMYVVPALEGVRDARTVEGSVDWMKALPDDMPLSEVVLPGTHDSATEYVQLAYFSRCQAYSIRAQLDAGFRYLDIRLDDGEGLPLVHGFTHCTVSGWPWAKTLYLREVLNACCSFLQENPTETVVFCVKHEHGGASDADFAEALGGFIAEKPEFWYEGSALPTVGEARGKLVLLKRFDDGGKLPGVAFNWTDQPGCADPSLNTEANENPACTIHVQDRYEYDADEKWAAVLAGMASAEVSPTDVSLNFLSTKGHTKYGHPYKYASVLNEKPEGSALRGWIIVDFGTRKLAETIYSANFGQ